MNDSFTTLTPPVVTRRMHGRIRVRLHFLPVVVMALAASWRLSFAQTNSTATAKNSDAVAQCEEEIRQKVNPIQAKYAKGLDALAKSYQAKGELENLMAVKTEQARVMKDRRIEGAHIVFSPSRLRRLQKKYKARMEQMEQRTAKRCLSSLEEHRKNLTIQGKLDEAMAVNKDIEKLQEQYRQQAQQGNWRSRLPTIPH